MTRLQDQCVVITGASSGIGRETALRFAARGASVVAAARNRLALGSLVREIQRQGRRCHAVVTDVADWPQVKRLAQEAAGAFGRIDVWVNNAAVIEYATVDQMTIEEFDRVIRVNLLGTIYGAKAALEHMKRQDSGTIINVASIVAERAVPLLAAYCASKYGIKGFTQSLRLELEREKSRIKVSLILPASVNTPLFNHARSKIRVKPMPLPPVYDPRVVADAIVHAAEHPRPRIVVGGGGRFLGVVERLSPRLADRYMLQGDRAARRQMTDQPENSRDNLFEPLEESGAVRGDFGRKAKGKGWYTALDLNAPVKGILFGASIFALTRLFQKHRSRAQKTAPNPQKPPIGESPKVFSESP